MEIACDNPIMGWHRQSLTSNQKGSGGKWQTPHQKAKAASRGSGTIEPGDAGIWATCARNQEGKATEELKAMFEEVGKLLDAAVSTS